MRRVLILCWHAVLPTAAFPGNGHAVEKFHRQLEAVGRVGNIVSFREVLEARASRAKLPPRPVALTFDDGYLDALTVVGPALHEKGMTGTFFVVPSLLDGGSAWWEDLGDAFLRAKARTLSWKGAHFSLATTLERARAYQQVADRLKLLNGGDRWAEVRIVTSDLRPSCSPDARLFMNWAELQTLADAGHEIASHTASHPILARETQEIQVEEIQGSKSAIESRLGLGSTVRGIAYPNGRIDDYDEGTVALVRRSGYSYAVTTRPGLASFNEPFELHRVVVDPYTNMRSLVTRAIQGVRRRMHGR